jgi:hypothetical protein
MTKRAAAIVGKWRIVEANLWSRKGLDLVEPAYIRFDRDGEFHFICVNGTIDGGFSSHSADFDWYGFDEMTETRGHGTAEVGDDDVLTIEIAFHQGDEAVLKARRW